MACPQKAIILKKGKLNYYPQIVEDKCIKCGQAEEVCENIRAVIRKLYGAKVARAISILYGGSMNEKNAYDLLAQPDIDGGLIGGASLVPEKFVKIIEAANQPTI